MDFYGEQYELPDQPWHSQEHQQLWYEAEEAAKVDANLNAFIQQLKKMAPMVREIEVECGNIYVDRFPETQYFQSLLVRLFQSTPRVVHRIRSEAGPVDILADSVSNLVHTDIESRSIDPIAQLAWQSAMTLQSLVIETRGYGDATGLFKDAYGNYAEYPRLRVLKLKHYSEHYGRGKPVFPDLVPFLRLWHLTMDNYPFGDDVIFRENADTLEYLDLRADKDDITMFVEHI
ncbi:hypothetical protein H4S07_001228 [Coemansia furcata]|uniref:Uncharacterized protein n=1 Tax=Coemansia furcata TaxID=417177 RepID=A0ACC1LP25_9FUNG|nr:hypothetical protein H4S07_001228 [Coemansia furcata]